jgi:hypothetical protein
VRSLFGKTVVSTIITKSRWLIPLNVVVRWQSVTSKECVTAHNNTQILLFYMCHQVWGGGIQFLVLQNIARHYNLKYKENNKNCVGALRRGK